MSATNSFETNFLGLIFDNTAIANIGDASGLQPSGTTGNLYVGLFTADPGETGDQANECSYTSYARVEVARNTGWTVSGNSTTNAANIAFPEATGGSETASHFAILTASTSGDMLLYGSLTANLAITSGITPNITAGNLTVTAN